MYNGRQRALLLNRREHVGFGPLKRLIFYIAFGLVRERREYLCFPDVASHSTLTSQLRYCHFLILVLAFNYELRVEHYRVA